MYRLALALGVWDVEAWLDEMSATQLGRWLEYMSLEPFGEISAESRAARLSALLANIWRPKNSQPVTPRQFMPAQYVGQARPARSNWQEAKLWAMLHNARRK